MSDALDNVTTMNQILSSLETGHSKIPLSKMDEFLMAFNLMMQQGTIPGFRNPEVRLEMLTTMLMNLARYFNKFTDLDYQAWFTEKLRFLLPGINGDLLQLIPLDLNFPSYKAIFGGLDQVYPELPEQTSRHIYDLMKMIMEGQLNVSGHNFMNIKQ
ncbi:uncharacterized protein LOC103282171 [Anolis carolinensis]|uniref:uncharacterized protein LOC103282171 n=1 Tax=Anolis carolinensis TaxID=28377 RepID=UPI002F2B3E2A